MDWAHVGAARGRSAGNPVSTGEFTKLCREKPSSSTGRSHIRARFCGLAVRPTIPLGVKSLNRLLSAAAVTAVASLLCVQTAVAQTPAAATAAPVAQAAPSAAAPVTPNGDLVETARASGQFTTFLKALDTANLTSVLKNNQGLTVFAPTDAAFAAMPPADLAKLMGDRVALQKVMTHHIVNARVDSSKIKGAKGPIPSVAGDQVMLDGSEDVLKVDNADIVQADVMASNGVLHVVDKVMVPGGAASSGSASASASASTPAATPSASAGAQTPAAAQ